MVYNINYDKGVFILKLNDIIKKERLKLNLNQVELSKIMNVSKQTVSNWENGNRTPDVITLSQLADIFSCSVDYLLGRVDHTDSILCSHEIDGEKIIVEVSKEVYPNGITKEELIEKLKIVKQLEEMGMTFPTINNK